MKKWVISSLVGAVILFAWQGASWMFLGIHNDAMKYLPAQDNVMNVLSSNISEDGAYMLPSAPTKKEQEELVKTMEGKPWATVFYHKSWNADIPRRMIRGFLVYVFLVITLIYILTRGGNIPIPRRIFAASVALGLGFFLWGSYMGHIWFDLPWHLIKGDLYDSLISWALCGLWLGWWLNRPSVYTKK